ncbi:MAG TPA: deoxyribonuclease IV [Ignavibacteriales bacterium]|nr:deoxyribonuclease IV [Ignavibacteriales bacterium]
MVSKKEQPLGAHTFITGGIESSVVLADKLKFTAVQIFTKNNNQWKGKPITEETARLFKENLAKTKITHMVAHDSYLINLGAKSEELLEKSREAFIDELARCEALGIPYLNFHPGAHNGMGEEEGIKVIAESLNIAHEKTQGFEVKSMLEATAGQGSSIGYKFEHLRKIIDLVEDESRMCVCIDTAHIFAAGYELRDEKKYDETIREFDAIVGLDLLKCFHMNDSKKDLGTRVDRHEHIGKGFIGKQGFANIMNDKRLFGVPKILETPKEKDQKEDLENLKVLRKLIK